MQDLQRKTINIEINGTELEIAALYREGMRPPLVFLHGFGSSKEDYADIVRFPDFEDHGVLAYDAPGCGATQCSDLSVISIPFLLKTAELVLRKFSIETFHLVGHSMGGLTSLLLADKLKAVSKASDNVLSFTNIEGNIAPEDCFLSRQVFDYPSDDPHEFFKMFITRTEEAPNYSHRLYGVSLPFKVRPEAVRGIFESMVNLSDDGQLMEKFLDLPCPKMFVFGDQNNHLSYLEKLERNGVKLARIPFSAHFPMYSNPVAMWKEIGHFIGGCGKI